MTPEDVAKEVIKVLEEWQAITGAEGKITTETTPIYGLEGFDSLTGLDVACNMSFIFELPPNFKYHYLFASYKKGEEIKPHTVAEIAQKIHKGIVEHAKTIRNS